METLPFDCLVEIFLFAGIRPGVRALSACKTLRETWKMLDVPNKRTSELMWFKFCQHNKLCPPPISYNGNTPFYRYVQEEELDKFPLPDGFFSFIQLTAKVSELGGLVAETDLRNLCIVPTANLSTKVGKFLVKLTLEVL